MDSRRSPDRDRAPTKRPKELSFYKRDADRDRASSGRPHAASTTAATGSFSTRRDPLDRIPAGKRRASSPPPSGLSHRDRYAGDRDRDSRESRDRYPAEGRDRSPDRQQRRRHNRDRDVAQMTASDDERELERRRREYKGGAPLQRVETRVEERRSGGGGEDGRVAYRGGDELRRVPTRDERMRNFEVQRRPTVSSDRTRTTPARPPAPAPAPTAAPSYTAMIEIIANDRLGRKGSHPPH
ncbi:hypothetical protein QFC22_004002 [Naganishia vaughanmartiniae]|uniref:Uncharacterized protein n=1 Tax=Naganishia vaughanmartiniae TaxID=1424756 RepID=A0ACC2X245_9TREE|nr:hypothetical protein QFC22_004002 [Naganishia vaughanmartiniae]